MVIEIKNYCSADNASEGVIKAISDAKSGDTLYFEKGTYHFFKELSEHRVYHMTNTDSFVKPDKFFAILLENKKNITIDGGGSVFVIHGDMCAFAMVRCSNIVLKNFRITYNSPTNFEMRAKTRGYRKTIYSIPGDTKYFIDGKRNITFFEDSPLSGERYYEYKNNKNCYCNVIHRDKKVFRTQASPVKTAVRIKPLSEGLVECTYIIPPKIKVGDTIAMSRNFCRDGCGLFFWECSGIVSENITVNYMHGFGWLSQMCENLIFKNIRFSPDRERGYLVSSFADLIHICGCKGSVDIDGCFFEHPHDDGINIHGAFLRLEKTIDANTAVFKFVHKQQGGLQCIFPGNKVKLYSRTDLSELPGIYTVKKAEDDINAKLVTVTFEEKLPDMHSKMVVCENITYNPRVTIRNCTFSAIPTRGILCTTTEKSEIYGNTFESVKMPDIFISCDCRDWYESGPCKDLKIHNNKFSKPNAIKFEPICLGKPVKNVHENIEIYDND